MDLRAHLQFLESHIKRIIALEKKTEALTQAIRAAAKSGNGENSLIGESVPETTVVEDS